MHTDEKTEDNKNIAEDKIMSNVCCEREEWKMVCVVFVVEQ